MNAMPATKITDPRDLHTGPDVDDRQIQHLLRDHLTAEGRDAFLEEMLLAVRRAKREGNLRHVNKVVDAWTRTTLLVNPRFQERWERVQADALDPDGETLSLEDVKVRLGLS